jgi:cation diffusion facilitator family transporter
LQKPGSANDSTLAVWAALIGDVLVTAAKIAAAVFTGSSSMTSEAIHSFVDAGNELLLIYGLSQSNRRPDESHPLGYGREIYFWSFIVALLIGALGAGVSLYEGVLHVLHPAPIRSPGVSYGVLGLSFVFEGVSWLVAVRQFRRMRVKLGLFEIFRLSKDAPALLMLFGNAAALLGLVVAAAGAFAASTLHRPALDGVASILIGVILAVTSLMLARESKSLLIGEETYPRVRKSILDIVNAEPAILTANGIMTVHLAPRQVAVMLSVKFADTLRAPEIEDAVVTLEIKVRERHPEVMGLFVKPQNEETFRKARHLRLGKIPPRRPSRGAGDPPAGHGLASGPAAKPEVEPGDAESPAGGPGRSPGPSG